MAAATASAAPGVSESSGIAQSAFGSSASASAASAAPPPPAAAASAAGGLSRAENTRVPSHCRRRARRRRGGADAERRRDRDEIEAAANVLRRERGGDLEAVGAKGRGERRVHYRRATSAPASDASAPSRKAGSIRPALLYTCRRSALTQQRRGQRTALICVLRTTPFSATGGSTPLRAGERETHRADWAAERAADGHRAEPPADRGRAGQNRKGGPARAVGGGDNRSRSWRRREARQVRRQRRVEVRRACRQRNRRQARQRQRRLREQEGRGHS